MVRARLASLTLAGGLLITSSGCFNLSERFQRWCSGSSYMAAPECPCYDMHGGHGMVPTSVEVPAGGPVLVSPDATFTQPPTYGQAPTFTPPPPQSTPMGPPPRIVPIPATPMPWSGQH